MVLLRRGGYVLAGCVLAGAAPASAAVQAQTGRTDPHLEFNVAGDAIYDDNVSHTSRALSALRGLHQEDVRFTPALTVDGLILFGRQSLSLIGSAGYDFYARNSRLNRERIGIDAVLNASFGRCDGSLHANYARRQSELGDLLILSPSLPLDRRVKNVEDIKTIGATAICGGAVGLKPTISIDQTWVDNSSGIRRTADFSSTRVSGGLAYARPSLGLITLFGSYTTTTFPHRTLLLAGNDDDGFEVVAGGVRYERGIGARLRGLAELSYSSVDPGRGGVKKFDGLTWRLSLTAEASSRLQLATEVSRSIQASNRIDANYFVEKDYSLTANYALSPRLSLNGLASQRQRDFRGVLAILGPSLVKDRVRTFSLGASYRPRPTWRVSLEGTHERRHADNPIYDYTSNRVQIGLSKRF